MNKYNAYSGISLGIENGKNMMKDSLLTEINKGNEDIIDITEPLLEELDYSGEMEEAFEHGFEKALEWLRKRVEKL